MPAAGRATSLEGARRCLPAVGGGAYRPGDAKGKGARAQAGQSGEGRRRRRLGRALGSEGSGGERGMAELLHFGCLPKRKTADEERFAQAWSQQAEAGQVPKERESGE